MADRNHATAVSITLDCDAEFVINLRLANRRRETEPFAERYAPRVQIEQCRGQRTGGRRDDQRDCKCKKRKARGTFSERHAGIPVRAALPPITQIELSA